MKSTTLNIKTQVPNVSPEILLVTNGTDVIGEIPIPAFTAKLTPKAIKNKPIIIKYASNRLREDKEIGLVAMNKSKKCYEFLGPNLKNDEDILAILKSE